MIYFLKRTKPSKKGEYLQIYINEYIPGKGSKNRSHIALGYRYLGFNTIKSWQI